MFLPREIENCLSFRELNVTDILLLNLIGGRKGDCGSVTGISKNYVLKRLRYLKKLGLVKEFTVNGKRYLKPNWR